MSLTLNNAIPFVPENTIDPAAGLNEALNVIDRLLQCYVLSIGSNTPPATPAEGDRHIIGSSPSGTWAGKAGQLARFADGVWTFSAAPLGMQVACEADQKLHILFSSGWKAFSA